MHKFTILFLGRKLPIYREAQEPQLSQTTIFNLRGVAVSCLFHQNQIESSGSLKTNNIYSSMSIHESELPSSEFLI